LISSDASEFTPSAERLRASNVNERTTPREGKCISRTSTNAGGYLDDYNMRRRVWAPLLVAAKLSHHRLHDLRHTFAALHLQSGTDPVWVSQQLGHHSVGFTLSRYVSRPANDQARYANRLDISAPKCTRNAPAVENDAPKVADGDGLRESDSLLAHTRAASSAG
jgi:hypothetical protein